FEDNKISGITLPPGIVLQDSSATLSEKTYKFTAPYVATDADATAGSVTNTAWVYASWSAYPEIAAEKISISYGGQLKATASATVYVTRPEQPQNPGNPGQPQNPGGGDGPSANYGQQETVSIPSETPVNSPAPQVPQEALQIPVETPAAAPLAPVAPKGELPFTGGDPVAFGMAGMSLLGVAVLVRRYFE
ncbi:MAG: hypothetical protein ACM3PP_02365, partial [Candidatus Saccharibacteria bacterium]